MIHPVGMNTVVWTEMKYLSCKGNSRDSLACDCEMIHSGDTKIMKSILL